jgi:chromosomal replication initiator protein
LELPAHLEPTSAWREISAELRKRVGESTYDIWIAPLEVRAWDGAQLLLEAPPATQAWVAKRFGRLLESAARSVLGTGIDIAFADGPATSPQPPGSSRVPVRARPGDGALPIEPAGTLMPRYTFEQFIIGDGNRLAHAAALAVAELPGQAYNPLFLHAPPGLGKTHLLHAIGNYVEAFGGGATVRYTTVEAFTNHFITALSNRSLDRFKHAYRDADVLLIDDVQFLASKAKTEEEFFHTFNALYETGRQLVLTCDRLPRQLHTVEQRLRERFESGLVAELASPDHATRVAILRKRAALDGIEIPDPAVLELIADRVTDNVRTLEGALIRIVAHHSLTSRPITVELARAVLDHIHPERDDSTISIESIQTAVAAYYGISVGELISAGRTARIARPRQVALYLARDLTEMPLTVIGSAFGGRNHATVVHACKRVTERQLDDQQTVDDIRQLTATIRGGDADRNC